MVVLSSVLYFLSHHPLWSFLLILFGGIGLGVLLSVWRAGIGWAWLSLGGLLLAQANIFAGSFLNAAFLNAYGTRGTAVIVQSSPTSSTLNDNPVWEYAAVLRTADGRDVKFDFDTMSASTYPIRNAILIPPKGETFVVKYVPGFERNVAILVDESDYGKARLIAQDREPVERARAQLAVSPDNPEFIAEYRQAVEAFLDKHRDQLDPAQVQSLQQRVDELQVKTQRH